MDFWATKTRSEREQEEDERLVRPNPSNKPPRRDLRRERVAPEKDPDADDASDQKDRSRNYKKIADRDSLVARYRSAAKPRIPAKSRETGETVMISPDTLKEQPGKYTPLDKDEDEDKASDPAAFRYPGPPGAPSSKKPEVAPEKPKAEAPKKDDGDFYYPGVPDEGKPEDVKPEPEEEKPEEEKPEEEDGEDDSDEEESDKPEEGKPQDREKFYSEAGKALRELAKGNPKLESKLKNFTNPDSQISGMVQENPTFPADKLFPGVKLPDGIRTISDMHEALLRAPASKGKKKTPEAPAEEPEEIQPDTSETPAEAPKAEAPTEAEPENKPEAPAKKPKPKKSPAEGEKPDAGGEPAEGKPKPTLAEKAGIAPPKRRPVNAAEQQEALSQIVDAFPPEVAAEIISKNMHPDDVHSLVKSYKAAQRVNPKEMDDVIFKASHFYQTDPDHVPPPTAGKNTAGEKVSFDDLNPEEQSEATRQHQIQIAAMSLAAKSMLTNKLAGKGQLTGKPRIPQNLASALAGLVLSNTPADQSNAIAAQVFNKVLMSGTSDNISDSSARQLLAQVQKHPAAKAAATAYLQANDYAKAKDKFLKGDDESISEWQYPHEILQGLHKASRYFDERNKLYGTEGTPHPSAGYFRSKVMSRLRALDPKKANLVASKLPELEAKEYKDRHHKWEAQYRDWATKNVEHQRQVEQYANNPVRSKPPGAFAEPEPMEPKAPPSMEHPDEGNIWDWESFAGHPTASKKPAAEKKPLEMTPEEHKAMGETAEKAVKKSPKLKSKEVDLDEDEQEEVARAAEEMVKNPPKLQDKQANDFTYLATPVMGKTAVYHGVDPYAYGPAAYPGWLQPHQRDIGEADFKVILGMADDWLKSPLLSVASEGMVPDARYRAALDLAIYDSPYNQAINATQYNKLLAQMAGVTPPGLGETLLTIRKATGNFKTETRYLVVHGSTPITAQVLSAVEGEQFPFTDEDGKKRKAGCVAVRVTRTVQASELPQPGQVGETVVRIDFPQGSEQAALRGVQAALTKFHLAAEKTTPGYLPKFRASSFSPTPSVPTGGSTPMKASQEIRKFAAEVAKTNSKLAFDMLASADRIAEEEKKMPPWLEKKVEDKKEDKGEDKDQQSKEAGLKASNLRALIIKQASSVEASHRGAWLPVLQALKDLG